MSRLLNPKRTPRSTPILQKFSRLNLQKITPEKSDPQTTMPLLNRLTSPPPMGSRMPNMSRTPPNLIPIQTTTNPLRNRNSTSPIYHGMNLQIARQPAIATPVARKPVGYYEFTIAISPKPSSLSKSPPDCLPESLPQSSSQWERILKGDSVDLNQIFSALHLVVIDEERTGCLGSAEISFGVPEPKKRISTAAEWSSAWRKASKAIAFAFPHRREELLEYGDYIEPEFAAKIISSHPKLLLYDIALRNKVAAGQNILLTDHHRLSRLYSAIVMPDGVESFSDRSNSRKLFKPTKGEKPELCNKFNAGTCKKSDAECKYRHLCKNCRKSGHGSKTCTDGSK